MNGGFFWSAFVPCPAKGDDFSDENYADSEPPPMRVMRFPLRP